MISLSSLLATDLRIRVVDIGANPIDGQPPYLPLLQAGCADVLGFEPQPEALAELNRKKGPHETYLPLAIGDGKRHTLHICQSPGMTSLLQPNPAVLGLLHGFPDWGRVLKSETIETSRLDDIAEAADLDLLKIDVQGAELMVFENATSALRNAVLIQTEVEFLPFYVDQPLFADVDSFLRRQGFVLHRFDQLKSRVLKPLLVNKDIYAGLSQVFWTDAIYIRDFTRLDLFSPGQLLRLALILHDCYRSVDMVLYLLLEHDRRCDTRYGPLYQKEVLKA
jgi:FkbM family methyltransferase